MSAAGDIAVVGIGCRFPDADNPEAFYENLCAGKDSVREIPENRWTYHSLYSPNGGKNRISSKWGGFISDVDQFDARFFKILPSEAELLDPQQKLFLTCSWEALEDAGYSQRRALAGKPVGVYAGVTWNEFSLLANEYGYLRDKYAGAGSLYWGIPNRVSYFFDFVGPSLAIDSACSSSLLALHLAAQALASGECEMALAGGVNLNLHPAKYLFLSSSNFLSTEGKCRGFGEGGSGYVPSEGVGVVVLKRMESAVAAGDRIYGCIKATSTNHGGKATGYTVPNPRAHAALIGAALRKANVSADQLRFVECHGTGTDLGDPVEIAGLRSAFQGSTSKRGFCGIGTVKSNIGHCEAAAGVAGLIKVLMSMRGGLLPRTLHAEVPNRKIDFKDSPFYLVQQNEPLNRESPLLAGVSSFGAGGSNAHCIVEAVPARAERKGVSAPAESMWLIPISARTAESAREYCRELLAYVRRRRPSLDSVVRTLRRREEHEHRVVLAAESLDGLIDALERVVAAPSASSVVVGLPASSAPAHVGERLLADAEKWLRRTASFESWPAPTSAPLVWLPTYRFERARSWPDPSRVLYRLPPNPAPLHPLLDSNESTVKRGVFKKILRRHEYFVDEHFVRGEPVLPGVCHLEMASCAGSHYLDGEAVRLSDVWFLEPVSLEGRHEVPLRLEITAAGEAYGYEVRQADTGVLHSAGKLQIPSRGATIPERLPLDEIDARCTDRLTSEGAYRLFADKGIAQRGRFQVVTDFRCNEQEAIGRVALSSAFAESDEYAFHPTLLDGAVQVAMLHFHCNVRSGVVLPFQIGSYLRHGPTPTAAAVVARVKNLAARRYDLFITDAQGNILVELEDFVLKEVREKRTERRALCFSHVWRPSEEGTIRSTSPAAEEVPTLWLGPSAPPDQVPDIGRAGTWLPWEPGQALPERELARWLGEVVGQVPRVVLPLRTPRQTTPDLGSPEAREVLSGVIGALQALGRQNVPLDVIVGLRADTPSARPWAVAAASLLRSLNLELPRLRARLVEIGSDAPDRSWTAQLAAESRRSDAAPYVRWQAGGGRFVAVPKLVDLEAQAQSRTVGPAAWLVTGGGGALGFQVARELLRAGRSVVMLGRKPLDERKLRMLDDISTDRWAFVACDARVEGAATDAIARATKRFGSKWGLVHCAGVLDDGSFLQKAWPAFEQVVATKVGTLMNACRALAPHGLEQVLLFSSLSATFGNRGQTDYAFANGFLDGLADPDGPGLPGAPRVSSIDWPYWQEGGMRISEERLPSYAQSFLSEPLPSDVGMGLVRAFLERGPLQAAVLYSSTNLDEIEARLSLKALPALPEPVRVQAPRAAAPITHGQAGPEANRALIQTYWIRFLERELKLSVGEGDLNINLSELGVDSIAQMDLLLKLESEGRFGRLPQSLFEEHRTITRLVEFFWNNHRDADYGAQ